MHGEDRAEAGRADVREMPAEVAEIRVLQQTGEQRQPSERQQDTQHVHGRLLQNDTRLTIHRLKRSGPVSIVAAAAERGESRKSRCPNTAISHCQRRWTSVSPAS
jgi:hypothetical protein